MADDISQAVFGTWFTPRRALAELAELGPHTASDAINERVSSGLLRVAASRLQEKGSNPEYFVIIPRGLWEADMPSGHHPFWGRGDVVISIRRPHAPSRDFSYFGVRFDADGIEQMKIDAGLAASVESPSVEGQPGTSRKAELPDALLSSWATIFNKAYPNASEALASQSVAGMFPDKHVSRVRLRRVLPERRPGRPLTSHKKT